MLMRTVCGVSRELSGQFGRGTGDFVAVSVEMFYNQRRKSRPNTILPTGLPDAAPLVRALWFQDPGSKDCWSLDADHVTAFALSLV